MEESYNGILVVDKPGNMTSRDVVNIVSNVLKTRKIGHTGTLDPLATGVLVLTIGKYTKLTEFLTSTFKTYEVEMVLGYATDTLDVTGKKIKKSDKTITNDELIGVIKSFIKTYEQEVPIYSAVKINGKKLYEYARNDEIVELPKREVCISDIRDIEIVNESVKFTCEVSKGTYIRSLVRDIGEKTGTYATMSKLRRIKQGDFDIREAYSLEGIKNNTYKILGLNDILTGYPVENIDDVKYKEIINGVKQKYDYKSDYLVFKYDDKYVALYRKSDDYYKMYVKF